MAKILLKMCLCLLPLALTPLWAFLISDSYLNFGAGEKDLFLLVPWMVWSLLYLIFFILFWIKRFALIRLLAFAAGFATTAFLLIWVIMYVWFSNSLGV